MCVIFSILLTTYTLLDNVDASTDRHRRPDSGDTGDSEEQQEEPIEQESTDSDLTPRIIQGTAIGGASAAAGNIANRVRKRRKAQEREEEEKKRRELEARMRSVMLCLYSSWANVAIEEEIPVELHNLLKEMSIKAGYAILKMSNHIEKIESALAEYSEVFSKK